MQIQYVGPFDAVEIITGVDELGSSVWTVVARGDVVDVDDELAGRPPAPEFAQAHEDINRLTPVTLQPNVPDDDLADAQADLADAHRARVTSDPGAGLLAQTDNWQPAGNPPPATPALSKKETAALEPLSDDERAGLAALDEHQRAALAGLSDEERAALKGGDGQ